MTSQTEYIKYFNKLNESGKFPCSHCKAVFDSQGVRTKHFNLSHPIKFQQSKAKMFEEMSEKNDETKYQCTSLNCTDWFLNSSELKSHIICAHEAQRDEGRLENSENKGNDYRF